MWLVLHPCMFVVLAEFQSCFHISWHGQENFFPFIIPMKYDPTELFHCNPLQFHSASPTPQLSGGHIPFQCTWCQNHRQPRWIILVSIHLSIVLVFCCPGSICDCLDVLLIPPVLRYQLLGAHMCSCLLWCKCICFFCYLPKVICKDEMLQSQAWLIFDLLFFGSGLLR